MRYLLLLGILLALYCDVEAQTYITPEQAMQAVRDFWGDQTIPAVVKWFHDDDELGVSGIYYGLEVTNHSLAGIYTVRATDGVVTWFFRHQGSRPSEPIPLRRAAEALGWQVTWRPVEKEVIVRTDTARSPALAPAGRPR